jgi:signal transduction histidine kinase
MAHLISDEIEIIVQDNGIGMESEYAKKLFIRNLDRKIKQGTKGESGTGLGLILCKEFIERHRGEIWVESEPGKGSAFKFTLPVSQPTQNPS